jgi:hypothetical protein
MDSGSSDSSDDEDEGTADAVVLDSDYKEQERYADALSHPLAFPSAFFADVGRMWLGGGGWCSDNERSMFSRTTLAC